MQLLTMLVYGVRRNDPGNVILQPWSFGAYQFLFLDKKVSLNKSVSDF